MFEVILSHPVNCDICGVNEADYDGKTKYGPWAYMCLECFKANGVGMGLGKGQKIVVVSQEK